MNFQKSIFAIVTLWVSWTISSVHAFVPPIPSTLPLRHSRLQFSPKEMIGEMTQNVRVLIQHATQTIRHPLATLPWEIEKQTQTEKRRFMLERSRLHRELGCEESFDDEELKEAIARKTARAKGNLKEELKVEQLAAKVTEYDFMARLYNVTAPNDAILAGLEEERNRGPTIVEKAQARLDALLTNQTKNGNSTEVRKTDWQLVQFVQPTPARAAFNIQVYGGLMLYAWLIPAGLNTVDRMLWIAFCGQLYHTGRKRDPRLRMPWGPAYKSGAEAKTIIVGGLVTLFGGAVSWLMTPRWAMDKYPVQYPFMLRCIVYGIFATYFDVKKKK
eukprot:Nitzschia sp. Nitz4//scaffold344_size17659//5454//6522//NITZ4_008809-RA/size17659-snap-gene-0.35-mRNA-1//-1//CDS//3329548606//7464//frame0